jgi:hypothetical protein
VAAIYMKRKLYIHNNTDFSPDQARLTADFCIFCSDELPVSGDFEISVVGDREKHGIGTTGVYHVGKNIIKVYAKNRALADVLRSIAHEMTHMMQDEQGLINGPVQDAGGFHEDQANAKAGELIKLFAKSSTDRRRIYERINKRSKV